jgi:hypothetical protein
LRKVLPVFILAAAVAAQIKTFPVNPDTMVAIHVRRGDYLAQRDVFSHREIGWALLPSYYQRALAQLPEGLRLAVFSDDVPYARSLLADLNPWLSEGNDHISDLFLMASCRYMIIANSSFSRWAEWLNRSPDKVVITPKYYVGWR